MTCFWITLKLPCISEGDMDSWEGAPWPLAPPALPAFWTIPSLKQWGELTPPLQTLQATYPRSLVLARPLASVLANFTSEVELRGGMFGPSGGRRPGWVHFPASPASIQDSELPPALQDVFRGIQRSWWLPRLAGPRCPMAN